MTTQATHVPKVRISGDGDGRTHTSVAVLVERLVDQLDELKRLADSYADPLELSDKAGYIAGLGATLADEVVDLET